MLPEKNKQELTESRLLDIEKKSEKFRTNSGISTEWYELKFLESISIDYLNATPIFFINKF